MITVGAFEAKTKLSALLDRVEQGEEVLITRHGEPVARLVKESQAKRQDMEALLERLREVRERSTLGGISWKELRDAGRR